MTQQPTIRDIRAAMDAPPRDPAPDVPRNDDQLSTADLAQQSPGGYPQTQAVAPAAAPPTDGANREATALVDKADADRLRQRWLDTQAAFVDDPRRAVADADKLVAEAMQNIARGFANEKGRLEGAWNAGDSVDTESLRVALQRYRAFFDRLLAL